MSQYDDALQSILTHIWHNLKCDNIRLDLYHYDDPTTNQMNANKEIKAMLSMNRKGFKWKTLINDPASDKRYQIMQMNRPPEHKIEDPALKREEPLVI